MSKDNITDIDKVRRRRGAEGASPGADGQTVNQVQTGVKQAKNAVKQGADGRPAGAKDKLPRKKRTDFSIQAQVPADEKQAIVLHNLEVMSLGKLRDKNDLDEVQDRIRDYMKLCVKNQQLPTVAGLALAFGVDRTTLWTWVDNKSGVIKNPEVLDTLKVAHASIATLYEGLLTQNKIVPAAGFFMLVNNFGYKNQTDHVITAVTEQVLDTSDIAARAGLLDDSKD